MRTSLDDRVGQKFNKWTVLSVYSRGFVRPDGKQEHARLLCRCECGTVKHVAAGNVISGSVKGCGCHTVRPAVNHGMTKTPLYKTWVGIRMRILDPTCKDYVNYGGRGLQLEEEWCDSFPSFNAWILDNLGPKPSDKHSIDRIQNHVGYMKGNLRWATPSEQQNNRRSNRVLTFQGRTGTMKQHCQTLGLNYGAVKMRLGAMNWSVERALGTPTTRRTSCPKKAVRA